ncbi:MAG TPA: ParB/RepB/Spo0J family partition protein [Solirubrobacterales bacterium]|nr:ParB/RepB/Spo0J family partition protein [Solirubrobacterales bacterium]
MASATKRAKRGLGSGLSAILPEASTEHAGELRELPVELIKPNPNQPRTKIDPESLSALAASIESNGVIQPLLVRPLPDGSYELIAGERRWRAAQEAGLTKVPAVIRDQELAERLQVAVIENMAREDLNPVDEARACAALVDELGLSKEELARRVGRSRPVVSNLIRLLDLPDEALELLESGELSEGHGKALLAADGNDVRRRLARDAAKGGWSVRETESRVKLAGQPRKGRTDSGPRLSAEEATALRGAADKLESALGHEVKLRPKGGGLALEVRFEDLDEALDLARSLKRR